MRALAPLGTPDAGRHSGATGKIRDNSDVRMNKMGLRTTISSTRHTFSSYALWIGLAWILCGGAGLGWAIDLPSDFEDQEVVAGLEDPSGIEFSPDGRMFIGERIQGRLRVAELDTSSGLWQLLPTPFFTFEVPQGSNGLPQRHRSSGIRDIAFDPDFANNGYVYVFYMRHQPRQNRVVRITASASNPNVADPASETLLIELPFNNGAASGSHNGGGIHFGSDGKLYIATGDGWTGGDPVQNLQTFTGKLLRINSDGTIPADNPFFSQTTGSYRAIYGLGLRNPFSMSRHPDTDELFINEANGSDKATIVKVIAGANYGHQGNSIGTPVGEWANGSVGGAKLITGGTWYPSGGPFPIDYHGSYFVPLWGGNGDQSGVITRVRSITDPTTVPFADNVFATDCGSSNSLKPVTTRVGPDGAIYYLLTDYESGCGTVHQIRAVGVATPIVDPVLSPSGGWFPGSIQVTLGTISFGVDIHYTNDGSEPTTNSPLYSGPITLTQDTVIKARAFDSNGGQSGTVTGDYLIGGLCPPATTGALTLGARRDVHLGTWTSLPMFAGLTPETIGTVTEIGLSGTPNDNFGLVFSGYVEVPTDGIYTFHLESDDGSELLIGGAVIVSNDHSGSTQSASGAIGLEAGLHAYELRYFQETGSKALELSYEGPSLPLQPVPPSALFRDENLPPVANAGNPQTAAVNDLVELNGSLSDDPDSDELTLTWMWEQVSGPTVVLQGDDDAVTYFLATQPGQYRFRLTVSDEESSDSDEVDVEVLSGDGLVSHWRLDEFGGSVAHDAAVNQDGSLVNGPEWRPFNGRIGGALSFDGQDDRVDLPPFDVTSGGGLTVACWIRPLGFGQSDARLLSKAEGTSSNDHTWMLSTYDQTALRIRVKLGGSTKTLISSTGVLDLDDWQHVAGVFDGSELRLYHDGVEIASNNATGTLAQEPGIAVALGNQPPGAGARPFDGLLDEVRIYDRALSESEILGLAECTVDIVDCNNNGVHDSCEISDGLLEDCNGNGIPDSCDLASGASVDNDGDGIPDECAGVPFVRGDTNSDGTVNIADAIVVVNYLFSSGAEPECLDSADADHSGVVNIVDITYVTYYIFVGGVDISAPFPDCGLQPLGTPTVGCSSFSACP